MSAGSSTPFAESQPTTLQKMVETRVVAPSEKWASRRDYFVVPFIITMMTVLWLSDYPRWRIGALVGLIAAQELVVRRAVFIGRHGGRFPMDSLKMAVFLVLMVSTAAGLTGGLYSPFALVFHVPLIGPVLFFGRSRRTTISLGVALGAIALLAVLPQVWVGPVIEHPYRLIMIVACLVFVVWSTTASLADLTEAAGRANKSLERMREDLLTQSLERTKSLEAVSGKVAHELKNPLAAVKALSQLLLRSTPDECSRERLEVIHREVSNMEAIISDYLSFSRPLEDLKCERLELAAMIDSVFAVLEARAKEAGVTLTRDGDRVFVDADARRLKEAFFNVVSNAIESMSKRGAVRVHIRSGEENATIVIEDEGKGMTPEELGRLGTAFFTTRANGTGLGVVIAKNVIQQHGGEISYESTSGRGTKVTVKVPMEPCTSPQYPPLDCSRPNVPAGKEPS